MLVKCETALGTWVAVLKSKMARNRCRVLIKPDDMQTLSMPETASTHGDFHSIDSKPTFTLRIITKTRLAILITKTVVTAQDFPTCAE